jgi:hypothetical protein
MALDDRKFLSTADKIQRVIAIPVVVGKDGAVSADFEAHFNAPFIGRVSEVVLIAGENGADATDPMNTELDVLLGATPVSIFTTKPKLDKTAGTGTRDTSAAATGVTVGVVNTAVDRFLANARVKVVFNLTITTPDTAYDAMYARISLVEEGDMDPDPTVAA